MALPGLRGVEHIGITVPNMEQATAFFVDVLGCELLYEREPPGMMPHGIGLACLQVAASGPSAFCAAPTGRTSSSSSSTHPTSARNSRGRATLGYSTWQSTSTTWTPRPNTCAATE